MHKKAIILDLDNTVYSVHTIGDELFAPLFELIIQDGSHAHHMDKVKNDIMRRPFQLVARDYQFNEELTGKGIALLREQEYKGKIEPFADYQFVRNLPIDKFLVTTGFLKLQQSKVEGLHLGKDFKEIHIVDPLTSGRTKKEVFADIIERWGYANPEVLVVGDDPHSEIRAARDLGIEAILYDKLRLYNDTTILCKISDFKQLEPFLL